MGTEVVYSFVPGHVCGRYGRAGANLLFPEVFIVTRILNFGTGMPCRHSRHSETNPIRTWCFEIFYVGKVVADSPPSPPESFLREKKRLFNEEERANPCTAMACPENSVNEGSD